jgi:hypothetical protein
MIQIGLDFQGWPVHAMTLREILKRLGFEEDSKAITLIKSEETNRLLDSYPYLLEDDGMGYGVNGEYVTEASTDIWEKKILATDYEVVETGTSIPDIKKIVKEETINVFNLFREAPENKTEEDKAGGQ